MNLLILCYGNPLRGDDGVAWRVAERLRARVENPAVHIHTLQQLTPELMEPIGSADAVIFVDACEGLEPGQIRERTIEPRAGGKGFSHYATPEALMAGALRLFGKAPQATIVTVTGADFSMSDMLSPAVGDRVDSVVTVCLACLERALRPVV